jgi:hypothetical protein
MTFATSYFVTARQAHRCACCRGWISPGTRYMKLVGKWQGDFYAERVHDDCYALWTALFDDWGDPYDGMPYDLTEVFTDGRAHELEVVDALDAQRGFFPHAVCRIEFRLRKWLGRYGGYIE